jgi:hypothetical protein
MHLIELQIFQFLQEVSGGSYKVPPSLLEKFGEETKSALKKQLERQPREFSIRGSNIGKPLCVLQREQAGIKGVSYNSTLQNLYGELVEDTLLFLLYAAGVPIVTEQELVSLEIAGQTINGTLDIVIDFGNDPRVWDIKSASDWSFKNKFNKSFEEILHGDYFGYTDQLFFYSTARRCKVGGWIVQNKSSGEIRIIEAPDEQRSLREAALRRMEEKVSTLSENEQRVVVPAGDPEIGVQRVYDSNNTNHLDSKLLQCFEPNLEYFKKKPTGNLVLHDACTLCEFRFGCWENLQLKPRAKSEAKNPPLIWYTHYED